MVEQVFDHLCVNALSELQSQVERVRDLVVAGDDAGLVEQISLLEDLKRAASAAQARVTAAFTASQRATQIEQGVPSKRAHRGVAEQVALARKESPHRGGRFVGLATALVREMPNTMAALTAGRISEWGATCLVRETAVLTASDRREVDRRLIPMLADATVGDNALAAAAKGIAQELDAAAAVRRAARATGDRRVTIRPAPDAMVHVSALLPVAEGVAVVAALGQAADEHVGGERAPDDERTRSQVMADTLVQRVTGRDPVSEPVEVHVDLVITDEALLAGASTAATVRAPGQVPLPVPAAIARLLVARAGAAGRAWLRRLFTTPDGTQLISADSRARRFPAGLARLITLADQSCRTPWCDAPVRQRDHVRAFAAGGPTSRVNGQGLCQRCNLAKAAPGWSARRHDDGTVTTTTPTGHVYSSVPPPPLGWPTDPDPPPVVELHPAEAHWHRRAAS